MVVRLRKGQLAYFRRKARSHYPNEIFAVLLGKQIHKGLIEVTQFAYPALVVSTPSEVEADTDSMQEIFDEAKTEGIVHLGDIHSHPNYPPVMSSTDHKYHRYCENKISAILEVPEKGHTRLVVWRDHTPLPCKIEYF
jgi:proteasome lid subunit RPN8/RPN11